MYKLKLELHAQFRIYSKNNQNVTCLRILRKKIVTYGKLMKNLRF
jgi:hypothetical protein